VQNRILLECAARFQDAVSAGWVCDRGAKWPGAPEEAAILEMKTQLHIEIMRAIRQQKLTPRHLEKVLDVPQPRVSELVNGKISRMIANLLTKYLYRLGREVEMKTKTRRGRKVAMA
jgi:predicted XRE-type DNA-binding protein